MEQDFDLTFPKIPLWIVDDVPSGLTFEDLERDWNARWTEASTLITTRSKEYGSLGRSLDLGVLSPGEALDLLCSQRATNRGAEERAAREIVELLGYHPLAVAVAGSYLAGGFKSFESYVDALKNPGEDAVEFGASLIESLPTGHERSISEEHPDTLMAMNNLAETRHSQGDLAGARKMQEQVLEARRRLLGEEHPDTLTMMNNLALTLNVQGDPAGARKLQEQVLDALRRLLGDEHPGTLTATLNLAGTLWAQRDLAGARKLEEQVLTACRRLLGDEHPDTLRAMNNLAVTLYELGDRAGARKLQERVVEARRRVLGEEHPDTRAAIKSLAWMNKPE